MIHAPSPPCGTCGNPDAFDFAGTRLCMECYTLAGACCCDVDDDEEGSEDDAAVPGSAAVPAA